MKVIRFVVAALAIGSAAQGALADIVTVTGSTEGSPTFNRPLEDLSGLSSVGTAVRYDSFGFRVATSGAYTFLTTAQFDSFSYLYAPSLNPLAPLAGSLIGNDDLLGVTTSGFAFNLNAGVDYTLLTTAYGNADVGSYSHTIGGAGTITAAAPVPPPATLANIVTVTGSTEGSPTFNRPLEDLSGLSSVGTAVRYDSFSFRVATSGAYTFLTTAQFDSFSYLYAPSLNPLAPLAGSLIGNDDRLEVTTSGFAFNLNAGVDYTLLTTAFGNTGVGMYSHTIGGPGAILTAMPPIPEPETYALMGMGLATLAALGRRRSRRA